MRHADDDLFDAELAAALDDLLQRRHHRFGAVEPEALGARVFHVGEGLEQLGLDQLVEDRALAFGGEGDVLVLALDALLDPRLLRRRGDVHELDADVPAVGAAQDLQDLADGRHLEPQHLVDEDRAVEVGLREAVGLGAQLLVDLALGQTERIEVGGQVPHHAIGADQHQRADAVLGGAQGHRRAHLEAGGLCPRLQAAADVLLGGAVVAGQGAQQLAIAFGIQLIERPGPGRPGVAVLALLLLVQAGEEVPPLVAHRARIALVLRLHVLDVGGIGAVQEGRARKGFVLRLACHRGSTLRWLRCKGGSHAELTRRPTPERLATTSDHYVQAAHAYMGSKYDRPITAAAQ